MRIVIALGGNALLLRGDRPDGDVQRANVVRVATAVAPLAHEHDLVVTHGNGPQIDLLAEESTTDPELSAPYPLDLLTAQTQGMIGSLLARALHDALPGRPIAALVTHTVVRADDPAFARPTTPVGPSYPHELARAFARTRGWHIAEDGRGGWRRVVPGPSPRRILETETVRDLLSGGTLVVCSGGGGVCVTGDGGVLDGVEAVVDKDLAAARLAQDVGADFLLVLTDVPNVYDGYGTPGRRAVLDATPSGLRAGHYAEDTMGPKAEAAARFVAGTGCLAAIGALDAAYEIVHGRSGTLVRPDLTAG
ncbi:amino acid kinase family protein [Streptomyces tropicalis]|uniref:Carbamate kinase n=1 Tax=Streptomyces tropicalis TaxID=3034234 RepID=A0ABT6A3A4_9ACTN|nr:carbamate kinase [Streptomyces tropicalis]MDF3299139.1 carbamate kinase [Streptomyces tropicalis]